MADSSVAITAGTGTPIRVLTGLGAAAADQQVFTVADQLGNINPSDPDGTFNVDDGPTGLFLDSFDVSLANFTSGGTAPTQANSAATFASSTTASAVSTLRTNGQFLLRSGGYLKFGSLFRFDATAVTNTTRFWGVGTLQGSPTAAAPILNGAVFQIDYADGALYAMTYASGAQTKIATLTRPTDGLSHKYEIWYRQSVIYWLIDGLIVATRTSPTLNVWQSPYIVMGQINFTTGPSTAPTLVALSVSMSDTGANNHTISDGINPYLQLSVKAPSTAVAATDSAMAVGLHPSSPLPAGANALGSVSVSALPTLAAVTTLANIGASPSAINYASSASTNAALVKGSGGRLYELTLSNPTATAAYFKFYNKATVPTVGTDVPIFTIRLAASGSPGDYANLQFGANGKVIGLGLGFAITAAAAATDTAVSVAGIQVHGSYS